MTEPLKGWPLCRLDSIADVRLGRQRSPKNHIGDQMRPYLRAANVGWSGLLLDDVKSMNFTDQEMRVYRLTAGDLLLNEASGSPMEVGKPALWQQEIENCAFQNTLIRVRPQAMNSRYLLHFFRHEAQTGRFAAASRGAGIYHLGRDTLASWSVPCPPVQDQQRIVEVLDQADELRAKREEALALLNDFAQSVFVHEVGDSITNPYGWDDSCRLADVAAISSGITKGRKPNSAPLKTVPYLAVLNVQDKRLDLSMVKYIDATEAEIARYQLAHGDLLLTEGGDPDKLGRGCLWNNELPVAIHQNHIFRVRVTDHSRIIPTYLSWLVSSPRGKSYFLRSAKQTTGIASINATQLKQFPLLLPPIEVQRKFADRLTQTEQLGVTYRAHLSKLDELFASLQDRAFRGEL